MMNKTVLVQEFHQEFCDIVTFDDPLFFFITVKIPPLGKNLYQTEFTANL